MGVGLFFSCYTPPFRATLEGCETLETNMWDSTDATAVNGILPPSLWHKPQDEANICVCVRVCACTHGGEVCFVFCCPLCQGVGQVIQVIHSICELE